jgi:hypothetical protein
MVCLWLKKRLQRFRDPRQAPGDCLNTSWKSTYRGWQTVTSTIFHFKYFQHVCKLWQNGFLWLKQVFKDSKSPPEKWPQTVKYLMEIDLSLSAQTVTSTIFILKILSTCLALAKWLFYKEVFRRF